jgi:hypothetical protein
MPFRVFYRKLAAAIRHVLKRADDHGSGGYGAGISGIGVRNDEINAVRLDAA